MAAGSTTNGHSNGHVKERIPLRPGIYSPTMTFFHPDTEEVDIPTVKRHAVRLAEAGLVGLVTMGSNGEAVHLSRAEKTAITRATREALDEAGFQDVPVIVGASEHGIRLTIELCQEAAAAGGEYVLLVPPSYYRYAMDEDAIFEYYTKVADGSPLPVILYNYPGAVAGIDMDSDLIIRLAKHPNIVGTKFTCGNTGKLTRVALATNATTPTSIGSGYMAFGGMADFTAQTAASGGSGIIAGGANVLPKTCVKIWNLWAKGKYDEALALQKVLSKGDWVLTKAAIPGTKSAIQSYYGYGGYPRRPLKRLSQEKVEAVADGIREVMAVEKSL
ncbi:aldolase [Sporormia fimetaria CBS 119925]|uniref:Aldolase n=1 Tax=Sporormia fimetaria CBS 119925 TaxID=1340428 RepID=A0A6A6V442_9PLEO|nr:aldolase [Sporormia fimetaria CBS 119925]